MGKVRRVTYGTWAGWAFLVIVASPVSALDLPTLDKLSVMMSRDQVRNIAGMPDDTAALTPDLALET